MEEEVCSPHSAKCLIKHKLCQKKSKLPLPLFLGVKPPRGGVSPLYTQTLATRAKAWRAIPGVSDWVLEIISQGYSLQFARRPPRFRGVVPTRVQDSNSHVLRTELRNLLGKRAIEMVPPDQIESGFYSRYFLVPKKDGGFRPILDLRHLNHALMKRRFRMLTMKQIL